MLTNKSTIIRNNTTAGSDKNCIIDNKMDRFKKVSESIFAFSDMVLVASHSLIIGPKSLLLISQPCIFRELLAKQNAASKTSGVVGSRGKNTPTNASARERVPQIISIYLSICLHLLSISF
jgi:hypothetical protein